MCCGAIGWYPSPETSTSRWVQVQVQVWHSVVEAAVHTCTQCLVDGPGQHSSHNLGECQVQVCLRERGWWCFRHSYVSEGERLTLQIISRVTKKMSQPRPRMSWLVAASRMMSMTTEAGEKTMYCSSMGVGVGEHTESHTGQQQNSPTPGVH